jgi:hypothetical protein
LISRLAVAEKHNAAEPNILASGIAYQNWALKSPAPLNKQMMCQFNPQALLQTQPRVACFP